MMIQGPALSPTPASLILESSQAPKAGSLEEMTFMRLREAVSLTEN